MFRKLAFGTLTAAGLITPMAVSSQANAADISVHFGTRGFHAGYRAYPVNHHHHHAHYRVFYRSCPHEPWSLYGTYHSHSRAHHVENHLQSHGYDAYVTHR